MSLEDAVEDAEMTLSELAVGESGQVTGFVRENRAFRSKLLAMGLTPGTAFEVVRLAPLGDPVEIRVRGFLLSLRRDEARTVKVERS